MLRSIAPMIMCLICACGSTPSTSPDETPPVLSGMLINLAGAYDASTHRLGDLECAIRWSGDDLKWCVLPFGYFEESHGAIGGSMTFKTARGSTVHAVTHGIVRSIIPKELPQEAGQFHLMMQASETSIYTVEYDHVLSPTVAVGDVVEAGTVIGTTGQLDDQFDTVELQVNSQKGDAPPTFHCPTTLGTADFNDRMEAALAAHNTEFPAATRPAVCGHDEVTY